MQPKERYLNQPKKFWAYVRSISEVVGYKKRGVDKLKEVTAKNVKDALQKRNLETYEVFENYQITDFGVDLIDYFNYRANILNTYVKNKLMNSDEAQEYYDELTKDDNFDVPLPMNKQSGKKNRPNYLTCIINILISQNLDDYICDYDPRMLTTITKNKAPLRTLSRRVDGAFPSPINPIAIWEIKEYYHTTTFGSRIADGVYESLLDGMELEELFEHENIDVKHYMMVDAYDTWWIDGKSYLCRLIDMLNMGYVDEVLFGKEVIERLPELTKEWIELLESRMK